LTHFVMPKLASDTWSRIARWNSLRARLRHIAPPAARVAVRGVFMSTGAIPERRNCRL
jgi:hypothetical protein